VELLEAADGWDREQDPRLLVVEVKENVLQLQALCSAADPDSAWLLSCHLREELLAFLREWEGGRYLPRKRLQVDERPADASSDEDTAA
jgi:hypothetical protein